MKKLSLSEGTIRPFCTWNNACAERAKEIIFGSIIRGIWISESESATRCYLLVMESLEKFSNDSKLFSVHFLFF